MIKCKVYVNPMFDLHFCTSKRISKYHMASHLGMIKRPGGGGGGGGGGGEGGGGILIFSYIRRLGSYFWIQTFEFQYFLGVFRKRNIF